jgi:hypothetical protein
VNIPSHKHLPILNHLKSIKILPAVIALQKAIVKMVIIMAAAAMMMFQKEKKFL